MPKMIPFARKNHDRIVHLRVTAIHLESSRPDSSADTAKANGTVNEVKPRYSVGGWIVIQ